MNLFKKYNINVKDNRSQMVYGSPDSMRKKIFWIKKEKYDVEPKNNVPYEVYGIPDSMRKKIQMEKENRLKNQKTIFSAFEYSTYGPSYFYYIDMYKNDYYFKFGYSKTKQIISNDENTENIHVIKQNKKQYKMFINSLLTEVKKWNDRYDNTNDNDVNEKKWSINIIKKGKEFSGSNEFPDNYQKVMDIINKYFNTSMFIDENR